MKLFMKCKEDNMEKYGWWTVKFELTLDGEEILWDNLDECTQEHIADCIKE